jgi:hypothetical protein
VYIVSLKSLFYHHPERGSGRYGLTVLRIQTRRAIVIEISYGQFTDTV